MSQKLERQIEDAQTELDRYNVSMVSYRKLQMTNTIPEEYAKEFHCLVGRTVLAAWALDNKVQTLTNLLSKETAHEDNQTDGD